MFKTNIKLPKIDKTIGICLVVLGLIVADTLASNQWHLISPVQAEEVKIHVLNDPFLWDPFREMDLYRRRMYQMFKHLDSSFIANDQDFYNPQLSLEEGDKSYLVKVDLPGLDKDSINVELEKNLLTISGERKVAKESKNDKGFYSSERSYGSFNRIVTLPNDADPESQIDANYSNGVLSITIPRKQVSDSASSKKIMVK